MDIKKMASKKRFTADEKSFLINAAEVYGIDFTVKNDCSSCFADLALLIYNHEKKLKITPKTISKYKLRDGVDVVIAATGERINAATMTDEWAERLIKAGFKKYFV